MEPVFFLVAILGCADDAGGCREARVLPARYATEEQCRTALTGQLAENTDLSFPTLQADCRASGPRMTRADTRPRPKG